LVRKRTESERRKWPRLPLAIPVFVRNREENGKESLEFATALNVSAGGALIALRRSLPLSAPIVLEIPCAPLTSATTLPKASRLLKAETLRIIHAEGYQLMGVKFESPLAVAGAQRPRARKKVSSSV
jgi:hypothetical protein